VHLSYCTQLTLDGIHTLLNNCPRLTHLSLTGVQSFLRDDLTVFCREAPPEFTEHQRDVFCVFSGPGVARLREHLNGMSNYLMPTDGDDGDGRHGEESPAVPPHFQLLLNLHNHHLQQTNPPPPPSNDMIDDEDLEGDTEINDVGDDAQTETDEGAIVTVAVAYTPTQNNTRPMSADESLHSPTPQIPPFSMTDNAARSNDRPDRIYLPSQLGLGRNGPRLIRFHIEPEDGTAQQQATGSAQQVTGMMGATMLEDTGDDVRPFDGSEPSTPRE